MEFLILDTNFIDQQILDRFKSVIWTDRYSAYGDFELFLPPTESNLKHLQQDYYLYSVDTEHTMIIEDIRITSDVETGNALIVTGRSLESILERRIVWQQTILSDNFQSGIQRLINESIISPTDSTRRIPNFRFLPSTDPHITNLTVDTQITGTNLYEAIIKLCNAHNIGFKVTLSQTNEFVFQLYAGTDRSFNQFAHSYVIFSPEFDNLINSNYFSSKQSLKTVTLVAGEGEGLKRVTVEVPIDSGSGSGLDRRELYTDARDLSTNNGEVGNSRYLEMLRQRGRNYLAENIFTKAFEGHVDTLRKFVYGRDFFMGDIVQIANEFGIESTSRVTEIVRSQNEEGLEIFPTFMTIE
jgi:hypothetical protein